MSKADAESVLDDDSSFAPCAFRKVCAHYGSGKRLLSRKSKTHGLKITPVRGQGGLRASLGGVWSQVLNDARLLSAFTQRAAHEAETFHLLNQKFFSANPSGNAWTLGSGIRCCGFLF